MTSKVLGAPKSNSSWMGKSASLAHELVSRPSVKWRQAKSAERAGPDTLAPRAKSSL